MAERGRTWSDEEIEALLEIWGEDAIQQQLTGTVHNNVTFKAIASALEEKGYERTYQQCREKIKALKKKYKEAVNRLRTSGVGVEFDDDLSQHEIYVNFKWFTQIHSVMGRRAVVKPPALLDTSNLTTSTSWQDSHTVHSNVSEAPSEDHTAGINEDQPATENTDEITATTDMPDFANTEDGSLTTAETSETTTIATGVPVTAIVASETTTDRTATSTDTTAQTTERGPKKKK